MNCRTCGKPLNDYDIGIYRKLMDRAAQTCLCRDCLAQTLGWSRAYIEELIFQYRRRGCTMFPPL